MRSLKYARLDPGWTIDQWEELTLDLLKRNESRREPGGDFSIGQYVSRGLRSHVLVPLPLTICVMTWHMDFTLWADDVKNGAHAVIVKTKSYSPEAMDSKVKHNNRLNFALAQLEATDVDPEAYPLLTDHNGYVTENIQANVSLVQGGVIKSPKDRSALQGDARALVRELAGNLGISVVYEDLQPYDFYTADEVMLHNTAYCIIPLGRIDNRPVGTEVPGPVTQQLQAAWSETVGIDVVDQVINYRRPT